MWSSKLATSSSPTTTELLSCAARRPTRSSPGPRRLRLASAASGSRSKNRQECASRSIRIRERRCRRPDSGGGNTRCGQDRLLALPHEHTADLADHGREPRTRTRHHPRRAWRRP
ncbi:hypothetical protein ACFPRL_26840 [Pseudoclavibacter helvolus]